MNKQYLGDGVYCEVADGMFKLTSEDGIRILNTIYLEVPVYEALRNYADYEMGKQESRQESRDE